MWCICHLDEFFETSVDDAMMDSRQLHITPRTTDRDDSPIHQVHRKNIALNLPQDWQPFSAAAEPAQDSPITDVAPSDVQWPPTATEYQDQSPVTESPVQAQLKSDIVSQPVDWAQLDKPTKKSTGDSPILQVRKKKSVLNLPEDWQPASSIEPSEQSPVTDIAPSELAWPPVTTTDYADQQAVAEESVHAQSKSDISSEPVNWEDLGKPKTTAPPPASFRSVTKQMIEGEVYETEEKNETSERAEDGSECLVRRLVTTRRQLLPVTELTLENGVEVSRTTSDIVVTVHVDEFVDVLPPGVDDPHSIGLETATTVEESEEPLETGGTMKRRVTTRTVRQLRESEISEIMHDGKNQEGD